MGGTLFDRPPGNEYSIVPFWFLNDELDEDELIRQLSDFRDHGVDACVIHPRIGLPRDTGWMSEKLLGAMRIVLEEAERTGMWVMLYDEGMYPSGSASGAVAATDGRFRPRALFACDLDESARDEPDGTFAVVRRRANGHRIAVFERRVAEGYSVIRGYR